MTRDYSRLERKQKNIEHAQIQTQSHAQTHTNTTNAKQTHNKRTQTHKYFEKKERPFQILPAQYEL